MPGGDSRAASVTERILAMDDADVTATLADLTRRFAHRHRDLEATWQSHFGDVARRLGKSDDVPTDRALLIGAYFTREVSPEAAALFNPSIVAHPDQAGLGAGETRFVMSLRALGEGHASSIEFRTGTVGAAGLDDPGTFLERGRVSPRPYARVGSQPKRANGCRTRVVSGNRPGRPRGDRVARPDWHRPGRGAVGGSEDPERARGSSPYPDAAAVCGRDS